MKMVKYSVPATSAGSYVELVRRKKKAKAAANGEIIERVASLTCECATMTVTLQEQEGQLRAKEFECEEF